MQNNITLRSISNSFEKKTTVIVPRMMKKGVLSDVLFNPVEERRDNISEKVMSVLRASKDPESDIKHEVRYLRDIKSDVESQASQGTALKSVMSLFIAFFVGVGTAKSDAAGQVLILVASGIAVIFVAWEGLVRMSASEITCGCDLLIRIYEDCLSDYLNESVSSDSDVG